MDNWDSKSYVPEAKRCRFVIGQAVKVSPACEYADGFTNTYAIVSITWDYQHRGKFNIAIASAAEIGAGYGSTDGFSEDDLTEA